MEIRIEPVGVKQRADDIADPIAYTTSRPAHVSLRQAIILPSQQA